MMKRCGLAVQMMLSCFTATVLIAQICEVNVAAALCGAGLSTLVYTFVARNPMVVSNSGVFVAPVVVALSTVGYSGILIGGITAAIIYIIISFIFNFIKFNIIYKIFPPVLIGSITICIGINLMPFIKTYIDSSNAGNLGTIIAFATMLAILLTSYYGKGLVSQFSFLIGTLFGYIISIPFGLVDFSVFKGMKLIAIPEFAFTKLQWTTMDRYIPIIIIFALYTISALMECLADHATLGSIIEKDLYADKGLSRFCLGTGLANVVSTFVGGLGACSYGEGIATTGITHDSSLFTTCGAAVLMIILAFFQPLQLFIASIPTCVIGGGTACILYGFISVSGIKILQKVNLEKTKNLLLCSVVLPIGISGIALGNSTFAIGGVALAIVVGVFINIILKEC